jgi:DNA-binding response OmpR family regulator
MRILVVDDSESIRKSLTGLFSDVPGTHSIDHASGADETMEYLRERIPDAVVLDIRLPDGSGMDVLRYARDRKLPSTIIMLTNYPYPQYRKRCLEIGADFFFDKSTEFERVLDVLRDLERKLQDKPPAESGDPGTPAVGCPGDRRNAI